MSVLRMIALHNRSQRDRRRSSSAVLPDRGSTHRSKTLVRAENLDSAILVMKAAENRSRRAGAEPLNRPMTGSIWLNAR